MPSRQSVEIVAERSPEDQSEPFDKSTAKRTPKHLGIRLVSAFDVVTVQRDLLKRGRLETATRIGRAPARGAPMPAIALRLRKLTFLVYKVLLSHANRDGFTTVRPETIAMELGLGRNGAAPPKRGVPGLRTVYRELKRLERCGLIAIEHQGRYAGGQLVGWRDVFTLLDPAKARYVADPEPRPRFVADDVATNAGEAVPEESEGVRVDAEPIAARAADPEADRHALGLPERQGGICLAGSGSFNSSHDQRTPLTPSEGEPRLRLDEDPTPSPAQRAGDTTARTRAPIQQWLRTSHEHESAAPSARETTSPTPNPAPRAGDATTARTRAPIRSEQTSPAAPPRKKETVTGAEEHATCRARVVANVVAVFAAKLCPGSIVGSTRKRRRTIETRLTEIESAGFERAERELLDAIDGARYAPTGDRDVRDPVRFVFRDAERVAHLASLARRAAKRAERPPTPIGARSSGTAAKVAEAPAPTISADTWRAHDDAIERGDFEAAALIMLRACADSAAE